MKRKTNKSSFIRGFFFKHRKQEVKSLVFAAEDKSCPLNREQRFSPLMRDLDRITTIYPKTFCRLLYITVGKQLMYIK